MEKQTLYDPTVSWNHKPLTYAPRPQSLEGLRVGLVDNTKHNARSMLDEIAKTLIQGSGAKSYRLWQKHSPTQPARRELLDEVVSGCDVVVCGVGD